MKKSFAIALIFLLIAYMSLPALAESDDFTESPSGMRAPELIEYKFSSEECDAVIRICAYGDRNTLEAEALTSLEAAYESVLTTENITVLNRDLAGKVKKAKIPQDKLAVSDLFDIYCTGCDDHGGHGSVTITIKPVSTENFVGLLHYEGGEWVLTDCSEQDGTLTFTVNGLSPFAIVMHQDFSAPPIALHIGFIIALIIVLTALIMIILISP